MASARQAQPPQGASKRLIGVIGGSGLYEVPGLTNMRWQKVATPFGDPSDDFLFAELGGQPVVFLPRHGRGHRLSPSGINYRANIDAMKRVGVTDIVSLSAVGSFREELSPGTFVVVDQFIDRTIHRQKSFFGTGMVAHVSMAHPVCARVGDAAYKAAQAVGLKVVRGGTYLAMEGPQFSSLAESEVYRTWGCHVIGMTNMPEAKLAREAELCYATVAMVTDYDCWHPDHDHVQVADIIRVLLENAKNACDLVREFVPLLKDRLTPCPHGCDRVLDTALITAPAARDPAMLKMLDAVARRALAAQTK
ncbi:MAG: S-methyl-5'-thioadenosine phosphorylase [Alphaproteobacteria bacterium]|nr:S-methyl-5'-thioadenosine phosphorylase [Alphaproteobacteria bacterium]